MQTDEPARRRANTVPAQPGWYALVIHEGSSCERWAVVAWLPAQYGDALVVPRGGESGLGLAGFASAITSSDRELIGIYHDKYQPQDDEFVRDMVGGGFEWEGVQHPAGQAAGMTTNQED